jgi:hypothetical protein
VTDGDALGVTDGLLELGGEFVEAHGCLPNNVTSNIGIPW